MGGVSATPPPPPCAPYETWYPHPQMWVHVVHFHLVPDAHLHNFSPVATIGKKLIF